MKNPALLSDAELIARVKALAAAENAASSAFIAHYAELEERGLGECLAPGEAFVEITPKSEPSADPDSSG